MTQSAEVEPLARPTTLLKSDLEHLETVARRDRTTTSARQQRHELMRAVEAVQVRWRVIRDLHQGLRTEATQIDPALRSRARRLAAADRRLVATLIRLHRQVFDAFSDSTIRSELLRELRVWCVDCRAQLAEHSHLLQEAHYRDRGVAD